MENILAFGMPGGSEWIIILLVVLLLFGAKRLPELAKGLGKSIREFKKATSEVEDNIREAMRESRGIRAKVRNQIARHPHISDLQKTPESCGFGRFFWGGKSAGRLPRAMPFRILPRYIFFSTRRSLRLLTSSLFFCRTYPPPRIRKPRF